MTVMKFALTLMAVAGIVNGSYGQEKQASQFKVEESVEIAKVPAGFPVGFCLLTEGEHQYVGYYDADRRMTIASRRLDSSEWEYQVLPSRVGWDSHNYITMAMDKDGHLHVSGNMHAVPLIYFVTQTPGDVATLQKLPMTGKMENRATYPRFLTDHEDELIFTYRNGGSGNGMRIYNKYDRQTRSWSRLLDRPLIDGEGQRNAYPLGPVMGPDGMFHLVWVWRDTPDCATNHHLSYARSKDLIQWESISGVEVQLPITLDQEFLYVNPIPSGGGIINGCEKLYFDADNRPIITYHKSDTDGNMQIYASRAKNGEWKAQVLTDWQKPVEFSGYGSMGFIGISISGLSLVEPGVLSLTYRHKDYGSGRLVLDEKTLQPLQRKIAVMPEYPKTLNQVQSNFDGMGIRRANDVGSSSKEGVRYVLQWETLGRNFDRPRKPPLPKPSTLSLHKLTPSAPAETPKPVQVYLLLGQSNMLGFGRVGPADQKGTLEYLMQEKDKYQHLRDANGDWKKRNDVRYVHVMDKRGTDFKDLTQFADMKNDWLTVSGNFGPEIGFGNAMGDLHDEPVLILKACIGNRSLGWDLLPPESERFEHDGRTYAGYKDEDSSWTDTDPYDSTDERGWYAGRQYDADTSHAKLVLKNLQKYYPGYQGQGFEIAGFVYWQGHKDQNAAHASRYEKNLVRFIKSLRKDFDAPDAKFVLATIAFEGDALSGNGLTVCESQLAVDGNTGNYPEFKGNVATVDARPFWRSKDESPSGQGYHYHHNAETYMEVGDALGHAMVEMVNQDQQKPKRPNILFCLADDWGWPHAGAYGDQVVQTPAFDRLAEEGVVFTRAFISSPSCTPCRNSLLTGQQFYRLEAGANLWSTLDVEYPNFMTLLKESGYETGHWRKAWGPGNYKKGGYAEHPCGPNSSFSDFMENRDVGQPFCFWFGTSDPHRGYAKGSGVESGIDLSKVQVPSFFPDTAEVRSDIADYYFEVQRWDRDVMSALQLLEEKGELENTIVVMTGDHGMPFPRCKGNLYDWGARVPLAIRWGNKITPNRKVTNLVSFTDLAPTFLEAAGIEVPQQMSGESVLSVLLAKSQGRVNADRSFVVFGRERHTPAQKKPSAQGYPARAIRTDDWLLILNLEPERWPAGVPEGSTHPMGSFSDCDNGPTKSVIMSMKNDDAYRLCFAKRPAVELYDCKKDPDQIVNLAKDPAHAATVEMLQNQLIEYLVKTQDPRFTDLPVRFEEYPYR
jgi:N-sulfoglucosamine sulfohydrolase